MVKAGIYTILSLAIVYTTLWTDMFSSCLGSFWRNWPGPASIAPTVLSPLTVYRQPLSLLLKASPTIDELSLYDVVNTPGVTADLSHISSIAVRDPPSSAIQDLTAGRKSPAIFLRMMD